MANRVSKKAALKQIREAIKQSGVTQQHEANQIGISKQLFNRYLNGAYNRIHPGILKRYGLEEHVLIKVNYSKR